MHASLRALVDAGAELVVVHRHPAAEAAFDAGSISSGLVTHAWDERADADEVGRVVDDFAPDILLVCSWSVGAYRRVARQWRGRALRILAMDNQWHASPKQRLGVATSRLNIQPTYDVALVADERGAVFASKLGFPAERLLWGLYTCDHDLFAEVAERRGEALPPEVFAFVGRLVDDKAVDVLVDGYATYRASVDAPWPLLVAGTGPLDHLLDDQEGVERVGFVQPSELPDLFERTGCLVLPSRFEPWGVVVHEATAAGLPVVCTRVCGASTRLVLDGYNGAVVTPDDPDALAAGLRRVHEAPADQRRQMGAASRSLAQQYTPRRWAANLLGRAPALRAACGMTPAPWTADAANAAGAADRHVAQGQNDDDAVRC
jgi:glycosyltransferase involved in cell wall biosynthesis